jgi:hypothetical protein
MPRPDPFERRRTQRLANAIEAEFKPTTYFFQAPLSEVEDVDRWRRAARIVGRRRGWKTVTRVREDRGVVLMLNDDPALLELVDKDEEGTRRAGQKLDHYLERLAREERRKKLSVVPGVQRDD